MDRITDLALAAAAGDARSLDGFIRCTQTDVWHLAALLVEPDRRSAFVLTQVLGLRYAEAALVSDVPIGTIRSRVARARGDLLRAAEADQAM